MIFWSPFLLLATSLPLGSALPSESTNILITSLRRPWRIICGACDTDSGERNCQAGIINRNNKAMGSPPFYLPCTASVDRVCQHPSIEDCVHGAELPDEVIRWSEDPNVVRPPGISPRDSLSTSPPDDHDVQTAIVNKPGKGWPLWNPFRPKREWHFRCDARDCLDHTFRYGKCLVKTEGKNNTILKSPGYFWLECGRRIEYPCIARNPKYCIEKHDFELSQAVKDWIKDPENYERPVYLTPDYDYNWEDME